MKNGTAFLLLIMFCSSCGMKHIVNDVVPSAPLSFKKELQKVNENTFADTGETLTNSLQALPRRENNASAAIIHSSIPRIIPAFPKSSKVISLVPKKSAGGNDPLDGHIVLIIFYLFLGTLLLSWGGGILFAGIYAASVIGVLAGSLVITLGLMPILGVISMMRGSRKKPRYSEE